MALSNILKEPRREITESGLGILFIGGLAYLDFLFGRYLHNLASHPDDMPIPVGMIVGVAGIAGFIIGVMGILYFTHFVGEQLCGWLAKRGLEIRPKTRY